MRIYLTLSANKFSVPYTYQQNLVGTFFKWTGQNEIHDELSLYSLSWLLGGKGFKKKLEFPQGALWFMSSPDANLIKKLIKAIQNDPVVAFGMEVKEISIKKTPKFNEKMRFNLASPILIKRFQGDKEIQYNYKHPNANELMTETLKAKLEKAGLDNKNIEIKFDTFFPTPKTKLVTYKGIGNKANFCPIIMEGSPEVIAFAWDVGVGNSTGIGFGALQ